MQIIFIHYIDGNFNFNQQYCHATCGALVNKLKRIHGMQGFKAKMVDVHLSDGTTTAVVVFDMMEILISLIEDSKLVNKQTLAEGYDFWTGKALPSDVYDEIHTEGIMGGSNI